MLSLAVRRARAVRPLLRMLSALPDHKLITMPALSPTMEVGTIQEWKKKEGDPIEGGEVIAEIETDKATRSFEYNDDGFIARVFVNDGAADIPVGQPLAIIVEEEDDIAAFKDYIPSSDSSSSAPTPEATPAPDAASPPSPAAAPTPSPTPVAAPAPQTTPGTRVLASPLARVNAAAAGIGLAAVSGTGPGGRVLAADVADALATGAATQASATATATAMPAFTDLDISKYRRITAERLLQSKTTIPHYYLSVECSIDNMLALRKSLNDAAGESGSRVSVNDFVIKASAAALRRVPEVNAQWLGDKIRQFHGADVCVAVQTDAGLISPIVTDADRKGVREISGDIKRLAGKAREGTLAPEEFMGGTFTVSNLGMYGVKEFAAIVNPPQAAILAVGTTDVRVVPDASAESGFASKSIMTVTLSCDHRVVDGAVGAQWLKEFRACIEDPVNMIV